MASVPAGCTVCLSLRASGNQEQGIQRDPALRREGVYPHPAASQPGLHSWCTREHTTTEIPRVTNSDSLRHTPMGLPDSAAGPLGEPRQRARRGTREEPAPRTVRAREIGFQLGKVSVPGSLISRLPKSGGDGLKHLQDPQDQNLKTFQSVRGPFRIGICIRRTEEKKEFDFHCAPAFWACIGLKLWKSLMMNSMQTLILSTHGGWCGLKANRNPQFRVP
uniref:Uncharacterized protein n=1 Tax=Pipistrellus kuhlii TaxID=59472 RepID=A0A7J7Y9Z5_PIPKU|nr:hypothetical protein mPipKuh1_010284 [Pipistrellus kuhlii]